MTPEAGACIATDTKPSGSAISWPRAPLHLLALAHHRQRRLADVLRQGDDHHRRERELLYRQVTGVVLGLGRVNAMGEAAVLA